MSCHILIMSCLCNRSCTQLRFGSMFNTRQPCGEIEWSFLWSQVRSFNHLAYTRSWHTWKLWFLTSITITTTCPSVVAGHVHHFGHCQVVCILMALTITISQCNRMYLGFDGIEGSHHGRQQQTNLNQLLDILKCLLDARPRTNSQWWR